MISTVLEKDKNSSTLDEQCLRLVHLGYDSMILF